MKRKQRPIIWRAGLIRTYQRKVGFVDELFLETPLGSGARLVPEGNMALETSEILVQLIQRCPWYQEPHELHTPDAELSRVLAIRLRPNNIQVVHCRVIRTFEQALRTHQFKQNAICTWTHLVSQPTSTNELSLPTKNEGLGCLTS